jgi:hypothetical protein
MDIAPDGSPWISYYDVTSTHLKVAHYVGGSSGSCSNTAWDCITVDNSTNVGGNSSLAIDPAGYVWVAYRDAGTGALKIATTYSGTGYSACSGSGWYCANLDVNAAQQGYESSIAINPKTGRPWISYFNGSSFELRVAQYVGGTSGTGCGASGATSWNCTTVDIADNADGEESSIAFDSKGTAWVSYCASSSLGGCDASTRSLKVANYVGSGGNCSSSAWNCTVVDDTTDTGQYTSLAINPTTDKPWVVYYSTTGGGTMRYASYVGSGGSGCKTGVVSWTCGVIKNKIKVGPD